MGGYGESKGININEVVLRCGGCMSICGNFEPEDCVKVWDMLLLV